MGTVRIIGYSAAAIVTIAEKVVRGFETTEIKIKLNLPTTVMRICQVDHKLSRAWIYSCKTPMLSARRRWIVCEVQGYFVRIAKNSEHIRIEYMLTDTRSNNTVEKAKELNNTTLNELMEFVENQELRYNAIDANCKMFAEAVYDFVS